MVVLNYERMVVSGSLKCMARIAFSIILLSVFSFDSSFSQQITQSVRISKGAVNGVFIEKDGHNLVIYGDPAGEVKKAEMVLFTHFRRDVIWAGRDLVQKGSKAIAPAEEELVFTRGDSIWDQFERSRFHDYSNQTTKYGIAPVNIDRFVKGGDVFNWQGVGFRVFKTPGYTRGSVSYITDIDGKRFAFVGDLIFGDGKIFDLYSLQDSLSVVDGYHGYAVRLGHIISSLQLIAGQNPDYIIPSRGPVITDPDSAINKLIHTVRSLYRNYLSITANRWNHPDRMKILTEHVLGPGASIDWMKYSESNNNVPPSWYKHISNTNLVIADDSSAFLIDCGTKSAYENIIRMKQSGSLKNIDGIFITHYHDDHTNFINDIVREFNCPVYITEELKDILENPGAFHMPCLTTQPVNNLAVVQDGQKMSWKNFNLTFYYFPGQTLYHDAVLFEKRGGETIFFIGDSFTACGIDDYCILNRNLLHQETGYFYCLDILKRLPENLLLSNQHIEPLFNFSRQQLHQMTTLLLERETILKELLPWDNINYGMDEQWVSIYPYGQNVKPGQVSEYKVKIFNHSDVKNTFSIEPSPVKGIYVEPERSYITLEPHTEGVQMFKISVSKEVVTGMYQLLFNIGFNSWDLHEWSEALVEVSP